MYIRSMWWIYMYSYRFQYQIFINTHTKYIYIDIHKHSLHLLLNTLLTYTVKSWCLGTKQTIFIIVLSKHQNNKYELDMCYWLDNSWNYCNLIYKCSNTLTDEYLKQCKLRPQSNDHIYLRWLYMLAVVYDYAVQ